jgi:hypothetical protein
MTTAAAATLDIRARDVTGQKRFHVDAVPREASVGELVKSLLARMQLIDRDQQGRPLQYSARLDREGRQLHGSELIGDALKEHDEIVLAPRIQAA